MSETTAVAKHRTMYDILADQQALDEILEEVGGEITGNEEAIERWINDLAEDAAEKVDRTVCVIQRCEALAAGMKAEAEALAASLLESAKTRENQAKAVKARLLAVMEKWGVKKIEGKIHSATVAGNGGKAPLRVWNQVSGVWSEPKEVEPYDDAPTWAVKVRREWDTEAIRKRLENPVPDSPEQEAEPPIEWAALLDRGVNLRIK